uniref:Uncharacterized protein n=1 Tax=Salix viminalis TaxID=40686 RepID=A0A6N2KUC7_SALVM
MTSLGEFVGINSKQNQQPPPLKAGTAKPLATDFGRPTKASDSHYARPPPASTPSASRPQLAKNLILNQDGKGSLMNLLWDRSTNSKSYWLRRKFGNPTLSFEVQINPNVVEMIDFPNKEGERPLDCFVGDIAVQDSSFHTSLYNISMLSE